MNKWKLLSLMLCCAMMGVCGKYLFDYFQASYSNKHAYEAITDNGFPDKDLDQNAQEDKNQTETELQTEADAENDNFDYDSLLAINSDCIGWIRIDGTDIDYPIVQAADNSYYLHHNFNQESAICGAIFMDYRNDIDLNREHLILYGHQMKDGWAGHMAFQSAKYVGEQEMIRVDYEKYLIGEENYVININNS